MRWLAFLMTLSLTGCWSGWEKDPTAEKGVPLEQKMDDPIFEAPNPAALGLRVKQGSEAETALDVSGLVQAYEGDHVRIFAEGQNFNPTQVVVEDILVVNPEVLPGATFRYDPNKMELVIDWGVPEHFVTSVRNNFHLSEPIIVRLRARHHSVDPEGLEQVDYRQIDSSFNVVVFRTFEGLQPTVMSMEPTHLEAMEGVYTLFNMIVDVPGSATHDKVIFEPDVRVVQVVPPSLTVKRDGAPFVRLDKSRPMERIDPNQPTLWSVPMMVDLRGREVTEGANRHYFGFQVISKYSFDNNWVCDAAGVCEYKEISSFVFEGEFRAFTKLELPRTTMTFAPTVQASQNNFVQWQIFDPEEHGAVEPEIINCPKGAACSCASVQRQPYAQCALEWNPDCSGKNQMIKYRARTVARSGPDRQTTYRVFDQQIRVLKDHCGGEE